MSYTEYTMSTPICKTRSFLLLSVCNFPFEMELCHAYISTCTIHTVSITIHSNSIFAALRKRLQKPNVLTFSNAQTLHQRPNNTRASHSSFVFYLNIPCTRTILNFTIQYSSNRSDSFRHHSYRSHHHPSYRSFL